MKKLTIFFCMLLASCASQRSGYLVFDFYSKEELSRKDYWLGLFRINRYGLHLSSRSPIQKIPAGKYMIDHIDRTNNLNRTRDDLRMKECDCITFDVYPDAITYLGVIALEDEGDHGEHDFDIYAGGGLMKRACSKDPELFDAYKVKLVLMEVDGKREIKYDCATGTFE